MNNKEKIILALPVVMAAKTWSGRMNIKKLRLTQSGFKLGNKRILYEDIEKVSIKNSCIVCNFNDGEFRFSVLSRMSPDSVPEKKNELLCSALKNAAFGENKNFEEQSNKLKSIDRKGKVLILSQLTSVLFLAFLFGIFYQWFLESPKRLLLVLCFVIFHAVITSIMYFRLESKT